MEFAPVGVPLLVFADQNAEPDAGAPAATLFAFLVQLGHLHLSRTLRLARSGCENRHCDRN
jgi:hypothetical protein